MKRREFLAIATLLLYKPLSAKTNIRSIDIIQSAIEHMLPGVNLREYFFTIPYDKYFDKNDAVDLDKGAKELFLNNKNFLLLDDKEKERALREFEDSENGRYWLSLLLNYGLEAMLGDPIYGGNKDKKGWKLLHHHPGRPRPKMKYGKNG